MSLQEAIDELVSYVDRFMVPEDTPSPRIMGDSREMMGAGERAEFLRLDSRVFVEATKGNLLYALPLVTSSGDGTIGRTHLPVIRMVWGVIPRPARWKVDMMALRSLAEQATAPPDAGSDGRPENGPIVKATAVEAMLGDDAREILGIARSDQSADDRMRAICASDRRFLGYKSTQWAELLDTTDAAIRKTVFWKVDRREAIKADQAIRGE